MNSWASRDKESEKHEANVNDQTEADDSVLQGKNRSFTQMATANVPVTPPWAFPTPKGLHDLEVMFILRFQHQEMVTNLQMNPTYFPKC